jgi:hypothetical protein
MVHNQHNELTSILGDLENIQLNNECSQQDINNIMNKILEVFETSGKEVFTSKNKRNIFKQDSKPWYTNKCYEYRKKIHRARKTYNLHKNEPNRLHMIQCSKQYKQITNKAYNNYQLRLENELRTTSKTNIKEFWKILNSFLKKKKKKKNDKDISMEVLYNHFENLNKNNFDDVNNLSPEMDNIHNSPITIEEIKKCSQGIEKWKVFRY